MAFYPIYGSSPTEKTVGRVFSHRLDLRQADLVAPRHPPFFGHRRKALTISLGFVQTERRQSPTTESPVGRAFCQRPILRKSFFRFAPSPALFLTTDAIPHRFHGTSKSLKTFFRFQRLATLRRFKKRPKSTHFDTNFDAGKGETERFLERFDRPARPRFAPDSGAGRLPGNAVFDRCFAAFSSIFCRLSLACPKMPMR